MKTISITILIALMFNLKHMISYKYGYRTGFNDASTQISEDVEGILTEEQYRRIPVRSMILMKHIYMIR